jgi:hypothetical protein
LIAQRHRRRGIVTVDDVLAEVSNRDTWRMAPLDTLARPVMSRQRKLGMLTMRTYLGIAFVMVIVKIVEVALK